MGIKALKILDLCNIASLRIVKKELIEKAYEISIRNYTKLCRCMNIAEKNSL